MRYATTVCIGLACLASCGYPALPRVSPASGDDAGQDPIDASIVDASTIDAPDPCAGGSGTWTRLTPAAAPSARYEHAMAYDPARQRVVLFGGRTGPNNADLLDDTWEWDGTTWIPTSPSTRPTPRAASPMVFNASAGKVMLYGGYTQGGGTQDTWQWDGTTWLRTAANTAPSFRQDHGLAYDLSRNITVLFGGFLGGVGIDGGTWELDTAGTTWSDRAPASPPSPRLDVGFAYDAVRSVSVLFGGRTSSGTVDETWEWNGSRWTKVGGACTPSSSSPAMAYDATRSRVMVYTGATVWAWNGSAWARLQAPSPPATRSEAAMVYDAHAQALILFGGLAGSTPMADTWTFR